MKTALYGRVSKDDDRKVTIEIQQATLRDWAARDPLVGSVAGEFWDEGISGKIPFADRPAGHRLMAEIQAGRVDSIAVVYVDRFGRTALDGLQTAAQLEKTGTKLVAVSDGIDARRDSNPLFFQLKLVLAEDEWRRIRARMEGGKQRAMDRDNAPPGGPLVFGFRMDDHGQFIIDPVEAAVVRHVFQMVADGHSFNEVLAWLRTCGVSPGRKWQKRGGQVSVTRGHEDVTWRGSRLSKLLRRREYIGERVWGGKTFPCPAIIDRNLFDKVQLLCGRRSKVRDAGSARGLCSGLLICGRCGYRFHYDRNRGYAATYRCEGRGRYRVCDAPAVKVEHIDYTVWHALAGFLTHPERILREVVASSGVAEESLAGIEAEEKRVQDELDGIEAEVRTITAEQQQRGLPFAWILPQLEALNARRGKLAVEQSRLHSRRAAVRLDQESIEKAVMMATIGISSELLLNSPPDRRRQLVTQHIAGVTIRTDGRLEIAFKWGGAASIPTTGGREPTHRGG